MSEPAGADNLTPFADCRACRFRQNLLLAGRCLPGDCCVVVDSGRQIDRFFRANPQLAFQYLGDPFWERRAIAVRYAPVEALTPLQMLDRFLDSRKTDEARKKLLLQYAEDLIRDADSLTE